MRPDSEPDDHERCGAWWRTDVFPRYVCDVMATELARLRPGYVAPRRTWDAAQSLDADGELEVDSLERLRLAIAVGSALQLHASGTPDRLQEASTFADWVEEARRVLDAMPGPAALAFRTSGSTGEARVVIHGLTVLQEEISTLASIFANRRRIVAMVPSHHLYGFLFTILLPARLAIPVEDARSCTPAALASITAPGDLVVAFPTVLAAAAGAGVTWPGGVQAVSSGAPCPAATIDALRAQGLLDCVDVYGATETAGIGWRTDPRQPFRLMPHLQRSGPDHIARRTANEIVPFELPDHVEWHGGDHLSIVSRRDRAVQVAGVNVFPDRVRDVLLSHPHVAAAAVRLMRPSEGEDLKAFVVPTSGAASAADLRRELASFLSARLTAPERPRAIDFGDTLPQNANGKPADWDADRG